MFAGKSLQPEITPNSEMCLEEASLFFFFFLQILLHVRCNPREPFCEGSLNPFNFNFVSCALLSRASRRCSLEVPSALKSLPAIGMKHHSLSPT